MILILVNDDWSRNDNMWFLLNVAYLDISEAAKPLKSASFFLQPVFPFMSETTIGRF